MRTPEEVRELYPELPEWVISAYAMTYTSYQETQEGAKRFRESGGVGCYLG